MSASRSWDVQRRPAPEQEAPAPVRKVRRPAAAPQRPAPRRESARREPANKEPLKARRKKQRQAFRIVLAVLFFILVAAVMYGIWRPEVRVQAVTAEGPNAEAVQQTAMRVLVGTYWYVFPRNSIFFYPEAEIREQVQKDFPDIVAVSISRSAFNKLRIASTPRISAFTWCGPSFDMPNADGSCFDTDAEGLIFKTADPALNASSTLRIYAPLNTENPESPIRSRVVGSQHIPESLRFVKAVRTLGVSVTAVAIRGDEGDLWVPGPTRITYVLGHEEEAAILAQSAFPALDFEDGTIQYVDLRFAKKVYVKRFGE